MAVVLGAGRGRRLDRSTNKVFRPLGPEPIIVHAARAFSSHPRVDEVVVVAAEAEVQLCADLLATAGVRVDAIVTGGPTRQASEGAAIRYLAPRIESGEIATVLIHDAARPLYAGERLEELLERARSVGAAIFAVPVDIEDGLRRMERGRLRGPPEGPVWRAQTPQAFRASVLLAAFRRSDQERSLASDTASIVEAIGHPVAVVPGTSTNLKITYPDDLVVADLLFERSREQGRA